MEYITYCILGVLLLLFIILFFKQQKKNRQLLEVNRKVEKENEQIRNDKLEELNQEYSKRKAFLEEDYNERQSVLQDQYTERERRLFKNFQSTQSYYNGVIEETNKKLQTYEDDKLDEINNKLLAQETALKERTDRILQEYYNGEKLKRAAELEQKTQQLQEEYRKRQQELEDDFEIKKNKVQSELEGMYDISADAALEYCDILETLDDFRRRREVVNQQIMREKQIQEETDFYRICLSQNDIEDLQIIKDIEHRFNNKEVLHKAAFDCYVRRPLSEMEKRVLGNKKPSGIYIITYIPTGEIYIGRSTDIANRWVEHVKSAFNLGTIAHSSLHTKMEEKGIWNFTFQILEEVPKDKLNEREKYWINIYGATSLLNQKQGG